MKVDLVKFAETRIKPLVYVNVVVGGYFDGIKDIVRGLNTYEYEQCVEGVAFLKSVIESPQILVIYSGSKSTLDMLFFVYENFAKLDKSLSVIFHLIENENYLKILLYNMSASYSINMREEIQKIKRIYEKFLVESVAMDEKLFDFLVKEVFIGDGATNDAGDDVNDSGDATNDAGDDVNNLSIISAKNKVSYSDIFNFVVAHEHDTNKFIIKLLQFALQFSVKKPSQRRHIELIVERQKDSVMQSTRVRSKEVGIQGQLLRYGLVPITRSLNTKSLEEFLDNAGISRSRINIDTTDSDKKLFDSLVTSDTGVVVLRNNIDNGKNAVEFNLQGLIDPQFIDKNGLKLNPLSGLTKKVIEKYNTAQKLEPGIDPKWSKIREEIRNPGAVNFYVFETIDNNNFRLLGSSDEEGVFTVPRDKIQGILLGITTRPSRYHALLEEKIVASCFDSKFPIISSNYINEKMIVENSDAIKVKVIDKMTEIFAEEIKNEPLKSASELRKRANDQSMIRKVVTGELRSRALQGRDIGEYSLTYVIKLEALVREFSRELERKWESENIPVSMLSDEKSLLKTFADITRSAADGLDRDRMWTEYDKSIKEYFLDKRQLPL